MSFFRKIADLIKYKISLAVTFTAFAGFFLFSKNFHTHIFFLIAGLFCLASGAMVINQIQEQRFDKNMERTRHRPLPEGRISRLSALLVAFVFILAGAVILYLFFPVLTVVLGLFNIFWYNAVYTPLKRLTPLAVVPGSLIGAVPALMGWIAAGGNIADRQIWVLSAFFIIWQIPHFWLILMKHNNDYEKAGFPGIERIFSEKNIRYIIFAWLLATVFSSLLLTVSGFISHTATIIILIAGNLIIIYVFFTHIFNRSQIQLKKLIISINLYMFFVVSMAIFNIIFS